MQCRNSYGSYLEEEMRSLIIIPAYNEQRNVGPIVERVLDIFSGMADVLVIDDGSSDETALRALNAGAFVVSLSKNCGYSNALRTGYRYAHRKDYQYVGQMDGDGQHDETFLPILFRALQERNADVVIGSRFLASGSGGTYRTSLIRLIGMKILSLVASLATGQRLTDSTSGFRAFNRETLSFLCSNDFFFQFPDANLLICLHKNGYRLCEVAVPMYMNQENRSMHNGLSIIYYVFDMFFSIARCLIKK